MKRKWFDRKAKEPDIGPQPQISPTSSGLAATKKNFPLGLKPLYEPTATTAEQVARLLPYLSHTTKFTNFYT